MKERLIHYAETFEIVTPESAEQGDYTETGFIDENATGTFRELVDLLDCTEPSSYPLPACGAGVWYTQMDAGIDYRTGAEERRGYHPASDRDARFMRLAYMATHKTRR